MLPMILRAKANRTCSALIVLLCLCVGMQMLGLSVAMWNPWEESDTSENLDFSILPTIPRLSLSTLLTPLETIQLNQCTLLLLHGVFRPPEISL
jgi:hypothetical protein